MACDVSCLGPGSRVVIHLAPCIVFFSHACGSLTSLSSCAGCTSNTHSMMNDSENNVMHGNDRFLVQAAEDESGELNPPRILEEIQVGPSRKETADKNANRNCKKTSEHGCSPCVLMPRPESCPSRSLLAKPAVLFCAISSERSMRSASESETAAGDSETAEAATCVKQTLHRAKRARNVYAVCIVREGGLLLLLLLLLV